MSLRHTPLAARHDADGAVMGEFAGWSMPMRFTGVVAEHDAVRSDVGVFDISHLGALEVTGPEAKDVIAACFTNDPSRLDDGASQYTLCCDDEAGVVDDLIVYRLDEHRWMAIPNAANTHEVVGHLTEEASNRDASIDDRSARTAVIAVQGPRSLPLLDEALSALGAPTRAASAMEYLRVRELPIAGTPGILARTGYTGEPGAEIVVDESVAEAVWDAVRTAGAAPCGLGARDTLRLELAYPLHGHELARDVTPYEAGAGWAVKLDHGEFRGRGALRTAKERGPRAVLRGLLPVGKRPVRDGMTVLVAERPVGIVTSGTVSPTLGRPIALARLAPEISFGDVVDVDVRGRRAAAEVVRVPFVRRDPRRRAGTEPR